MMENGSFPDRNISIQIKGIEVIMIMTEHIIKGVLGYIDIFLGQIVRKLDTVCRINMVHLR